MSTGAAAPDLIGESDDPPAVVNVLVHHGRVTGDAVPATVLDLAARGYFSLEQIAPGQQLCRFPHNGESNGGALLSWEALVLTLLRKRAVSGVVPAEALTLGIEFEAEAWWDQFVQEVLDDCGARGYVVRRWARFFAAALVIVVFGVAWALVLSSKGSGTLVEFVAVGLALVITGSVALGIDGDEVRDLLTPTAWRTGSRWLTQRDRLRAVDSFDRVPAAGVTVWGRALAYGAALGVAPNATAGLPIGPDSARHVWVQRGGMWRRIRVYFPTYLPPGWGRSPVRAALVSAAELVVAGTLLVLAAQPGRWFPHPPFSVGGAELLGDLEPLVAAGALVVFVLAAWELVAAVLDLMGGPRTVDGVVVSRWVHHGHRWNPWRDLVPDRYFIAVDSGSGDRILGWRLNEATFREVQGGDTVRVLVTPRLGRIRGLDVATHARHRR
jgi:hypothetical protein